jgi:hypothetical protein
MYHTEFTEGPIREGYHVNGNPQLCRWSQAKNPSSFEDDRPLTYIAKQPDGVAMPVSDEVSGHKTCSFASAPASCILVSAPNALHATVASPIYHANAFGIVSADPACQQGYGGRSPSVETSGHKRLSIHQGKPDGCTNRDSSPISPLSLTLVEVYLSIRSHRTHPISRVKLQTLFTLLAR